MPKALITGITGQDGSYLTELLLEKGYLVFGLVSKKHNIGWGNVKHLKGKFEIIYGDLLDKESLQKAVEKSQPNEIYNLAAISFIPVSWEKPTLVCDVNALGVARFLELIRDLSPKTKFFQASSAKIFGKPQKSPQNEKTPIQPLDPYAAAKAFAHHLVQLFRCQDNLFACAAIFYNHESERRGQEFVTRKITQACAKIKLGQAKELRLGNLEAKRDWGYAPDYVRAAWLMLQQKKADNFVIATGKLHSVRDIIKVAFKSLNLDWRQYVKIDKKLVRKTETEKFVGDARKAKRVLGWEPKVSFEEMIKKMVAYDLKLLKESKK